MVRRWKLAVAASALAMVGAGCVSAPAVPYRPVADVKQLMASVLEPAADAYWDAVGTIVDETGSHELAPGTADEWDAIRNHAFVIAETGNLLMMSPRAKDGGAWMKLSRSLIDVGARAIEAAEKRDKTAVFDIGAEVYEACTACHAVYAVELTRP